MSRYSRRVLYRASIATLGMGCTAIYIGVKHPGNTNEIAFVVFGSLIAIIGAIGLGYLVRTRDRPRSDQRLGTVPVPSRQSPTGMLPPPGWYPDPSGARAQRYWDGARWDSATRP
jgi:hypothetical protein